MVYVFPTHVGVGDGVGLPVFVSIVAIGVGLGEKPDVEPHDEVNEEKYVAISSLEANGIANCVYKAERTQVLQKAESAAQILS
jgi:hypothetical protein